MGCWPLKDVLSAWGLAHTTVYSSPFLHSSHWWATSGSGPASTPSWCPHRVIPAKPSNLARDDHVGTALSLHRDVILLDKLNPDIIRSCREWVSLAWTARGAVSGFKFQGGLLGPWGGLLARAGWEQLGAQMASWGTELTLAAQGHRPVPCSGPHIPVFLRAFCPALFSPQGSALLSPSGDHMLRLRQAVGATSPAPFQFTSGQIAQLRLALLGL